MGGDRIGKPTDIDQPIERTNETIGGVLVTLKVHTGFSQSPKHTNRSHAVIHHNETMPIHRVCCRYIVENQRLSAAKKQQQHIRPLLFSPHWFFYPLLSIERVQTGVGRLEWAPAPSSSGSMWCDLSRVISMREKPWCIQEIIRATQAGFRGMQIFSECLKNNTTHTHATPTNAAPPHPLTHTHTGKRQPVTCRSCNHSLVKQLFHGRLCRHCHAAASWLILPFCFSFLPSTPLSPSHKSNKLPLNQVTLHLADRSIVMDMPKCMPGSMFLCGSTVKLYCCDSALWC